MSPEALGVLADVGVRAFCGAVVLLHGLRFLGKKPGVDEKADEWHSKHGVKFKIIGALLILFALIQLIARHEVFGTAPLKWQRIQLGPVSVEMPGDPKHDVERDGGLVCHRYQSVFSGGEKQFASSEIDLGPDERSNEERLQEIVDAFSTQMSGKIPGFKMVADEKARIFGEATRRLSFEADEMQVRFLAFFRKGKLIRLLYVAAKARFDDQDFLRFFSSLDEPH